MKVTQAFLEDIRKIVESCMSDEGLKSSNLYDSIKMISRENQGELVLGFMLNDYAEYVDNGRRSGKMPPTEAIVNWCKEKGINPTNDTVFLIRRKIGNDGIRPRPFLDEIFQQIDKIWNSPYSVNIFDEIIQPIDNFFK